MPTSSSEDYLRTVYVLHLANGSVRSVDVARALDVTKASVHKAMGLLDDAGYVEHDKYAPIRLTEAGMAAGKALNDRYMAVKRLLTDVLGVDESVAAKEAHEIEHAVSPETAQKIQDFVAARG